MTESKLQKIKKKTWSDLAWDTRWLARFIRIPRIIPRPLLRVTSPEGPYPFVVEIPSAHYSGHQITIWAFLPPEHKIPQHDHHVPVHLDLHGGSFIAGGPFEQAPFCAKLARERGCIALTIDYCLSPLYQFPAAVEDAEDALNAVLDTDQKTEGGRILHSAIAKHHIPDPHNHHKSTGQPAHPPLRADPSRLSFSGWSSGGNLVLNLVTSVETEDSKPWPTLIPNNIPPFPTILFYPSFDQRKDSHNRPAPKGTPRPGKFGTLVEKKLIPLYLPEHLRRHPRASPGSIDPSAIHPKARFFIVLAEKDTLRYQSNDWIEKVRDAGLGDRMTVYRAPGVEHGWANMPERWLTTRPFRLKKDAYHEMHQFWDTVASDLPLEKKEVEGDVDTSGYDGLGTV